MFKVNDVVHTVVDIPRGGIVSGSVGAIVHVFSVPDEAYEVEFVDTDGKIVALLTLAASEIKKAN
ncbi:DUF4926 domain-containing protein [Xanthomonas campestris]|uniref:DUF4926 domain-containing protein n=1 Tax=Xanthomonas campestris TaxID=339 RepID=UPI001CBDE92E|nr:DUF4926 domain-containing protein [Xanthomonas campestris]MEA9733291.1 DUF4926 domain-containing protein [Xanthomonas campestris]UAU36362.1 DUF4926 domain-containing protein [Xanthomonas campestris pv. incanae]